MVYGIEQLRFRKNVDPAQFVMNTGYADDAIRSFPIFDRLQGKDVIPDGVKCQICSATPLAISSMFITPLSRVAFTPVYTDHLLGELSRIAGTLPHERISYQWDVCQEVLMWEGYLDQPPSYKQKIFSLLGLIGDAVPGDIELGYHLCYGNPKDKHCVQPTDMANLVEIANGIVQSVHRPLSYIHMPVPKDRNDDDYFHPLSGLKLPAGTDLYLGLIHDGDNEGNALKLAKEGAQTKVTDVAAECGLDRGDPDRFTNILAAHASALQTLSG